jgi:hypothetical protein
MGAPLANPWENFTNICKQASRIFLQLSLLPLYYLIEIFSKSVFIVVVHNLELFPSACPQGICNNVWRYY